ncbi:Ectonucleoside Triphosphate Diphosphohydrolase 8 [Manis pentadactyla]|nr:Ectonucleoside Triphosphate Diphosphohydrolase 8 [Manis pentadactyla]
MRSPAGRSRAAVWRFCERPGLLVLRVWPGGLDRAGAAPLGSPLSEGAGRRPHGTASSGWTPGSPAATLPQVTLGR